MTPEESEKMCCVIKCINTPSNSKVNFFTFPMVQSRSYQRNKWVQAIKNHNGRCWMPTAHSLVCSDHFVNGKPSTNSQDTDYAPSIFCKTRKAETIKSRAVSVKTFGLEYVKHVALLEKPSRANASNDQRKCAYVKLAAAVGIPVTMVRAWERRFRDYVEEKMADPPDKRKPSADGKPHWLTKVAKRLYASTVQQQVARAGAMSPGGVVAALCAAARARGSLCSTALYNDVRRVLRMSTAVNDLHAVWVSAQRVSLQQVVVSSRAGDAAHAAPPAGAAAVADLVLLHTDVDILTDESVTLYEESAALHTLWQLIQRHRLEDAAPAHSRVRAQRWTRAHRTYLDSGRTVSLVVLQRRWYELKLQARVRLAMHWRRPGPQLFDDLTPGPGPASSSNELYPRPAPLHIAILKRYPHIITGHFKSWRQQVLEGTIVTDPLEEDNDVMEVQSNNNEQSTDTTDTADNATAKLLYPNITKVEQPPDNDPLNEGPTDTDLQEEENYVKKTKRTVNEQSPNTTDAADNVTGKLLYPNITKVEQPAVDEPMVKQPPDNDSLNERPTETDFQKENYVRKTKSNVNEQSPETTNTCDDAAVKQLYPNIIKVEQPTVDKTMVEQPPDNNPLNEGPTVTDLQGEENNVKKTKSNVKEQSPETTNTCDDTAVKQVYPNIIKVEQPTVDVPMVEQPPDNDPLNEGPTDTDLQEEENDVKKTKSNVNEQCTDTTDTGDDAAVKHLYPNMSKVEQPTVDEPMVEQSPNNDPLTEGPTDTDLLEEENDVRETKSNVNKQSPETTDTGDDAAVKHLYPNMSKVEQPAVDELKNEQTFYEVPLVEQSTADDLSAAHTTDNIPLAVEPTVHEPKVEQTIDSGSLTDNHVHEQTTESDLLVVKRAVGDHLPKQTTDIDLLAVQSTIYEPKIEQTTDLLINQSTVCTHAESPVVHAGNAATTDIPVMLNTTDTQGGPNILSDQIHRAEDKSNEVLPPNRAYSPDTDTDTEDNLVIDECSNKTLFSIKREPVPHTETHNFDTVSPHAALENIAPTIEVLHKIDPNTVKTEILFESDEDDFQPCNEVDKYEIELDVKKEVSFISNRIMFVDEEPGVSCDLTSVDDDMGRMDWEDGQEIDGPVNGTPTIDSKLLMQTQVRVFRIDEIPPWIKNVRKDNSIRVSRIHRRYYTPKLKNKCSNSKTRTQKTRLDVELRTSVRLNTTTTAKTQEIRVDKSCLDKVANTHSIRQLCRNIKRELIEDQFELLEGEGPNKKAKTESDSDNDKPLLVLREGQPSRETTYETEDTVVREMVEESSSDDEFLNDEMFNMLRVEERKRGRGSHHAASTIEWSAAFAPALGRVAKRVSLPDIEQVRRYNSSMQVAQVAPITSTVGACGDDAMQAAQTPGDDTAADDMPEVAAAAPAPHADPERHDASFTTGRPTFRGNRDMPYGLLPSSRAKPLAWRSLDLPADNELQAALDELTAAPAAEAVLERSHCCAARRHREVNDTRRRIGLADIPLHNHPDGECACCCAHLSDVDVRHRLDQQLRALHEDIEKMLKKSAGGKIQSKPALKPSRSPSPARASTSATTATSAHKQATKVAPSKAATAAKGSKAKPAKYTNRSRQRRSRARAPAPPAPAPPVSDYEEWQRQKNMNAKYFHINGNVSSKKDKSTTAQGTAEQSTMAQGTAEQSTMAQGTAEQSTTAQGTAEQSTTAQGTAEQSTTAQGTAVQGTTAQASAGQSTTTQATAVKSTTAQTVTTQNTITQNIVQSGLMPYIRQSRLVSPPEEPRARRANPVQPLSRTRLVNIAPKLNDMSRASELVQQSIVVDKPAAMAEGIKNFTIPISNSFQSLAAGPRRFNLTTEVTAAGSRPMNQTTEQVSEPNSQPVQLMRVNSVPIDKPVSILEEYSRTLSTEPVNNTPVVNALSLRVPSGPQGPKTTILMALTLPSDDVIKQTINRLYANETVDLTKEPETSTSVETKTDSKKKKNSPIDLVRAFRNLVTPGNENKSGRSLLKTLTTTKSGKSLLKTTITNALQNPPDTEARDTSPMIMSLSKKLHDGDVIEIDDTDSNQSNNSDDDQSSQSNKSSIIINKSSNPAVNTKKGPNQAKSSCTKESSNQSTSEADESSNEAAGKSNEANSNIKHSTKAVSKTDDGSKQASTTKTSNQETEDRNKSAQKLKHKIKRCFKEKYNNRCAKAAVFKKSNVSVEAVIWESPSRPCSSIPVLTSLTDGSRRCPARFANVAAMTDFMATLRRAAAQADKEVYCHKWAAVEQPVSALPCGGTLLCVDGARPPLVLPAVNRRDQRARERATPHARAHLVLTDADPPCALPTYWTLASFGKMARVMPDELVSTGSPDVAGAPAVADAEPRGGGARWCAARGEWVTPKEDRKICEKNHNFKILTAFCSADGIRQAARAGASLLLLSVQRARVVVLTLQRDVLHGVVQHRASADVEEELLRELEGLLDEAEIDEQLGGRADIIGQ